MSPQQQLVYDYIQLYGSISPYEAFRDLGITKLATRVSEMRKDGIEFIKEPETSENRMGKPVSYMRYYLRE